MSWWEFRGFWGILQRSQAVNAAIANIETNSITTNSCIKE